MRSTGVPSLRYGSSWVPRAATCYMWMERYGKTMPAHMRGSYMLHVDGTLTEGTPVVFVARDEWSGLVLDTRVLSTEDETGIGKFFRDLEAAFGRPCGLTSDMGNGILKAAGVVWPGLPHQLCHFHYVRALGKLQFEKLESEVRQRFLGTKVLARLGELNPGEKGDWRIYGKECAAELVAELSQAEPRWMRVLQDHILSPRERASGRHDGPLSGTAAERTSNDTQGRRSRDAFKGPRVDGAEGACPVTRCWNLYPLRFPVLHSFPPLGGGRSKGLAPRSLLLPWRSGPF